MSFQSTTETKKPSLLQRNSSQLLHHASKLSGLKRSLTTKASTNTPLQHKPRPSISFSSTTSSNERMRFNEQRQAQLQLKEYIPPPPLLMEESNQIKPVHIAAG